MIDVWIGASFGADLVTVAATPNARSADDMLGRASPTGG
jgi:hypothetical protein